MAPIALLKAAASERIDVDTLETLELAVDLTQISRHGDDFHMYLAWDLCRLNARIVTRNWQDDDGYPHPYDNLAAMLLYRSLALRPFGSGALGPGGARGLSRAPCQLLSWSSGCIFLLRWCAHCQRALFRAGFYITLSWTMALGCFVSSTTIRFTKATLPPLASPRRRHSTELCPCLYCPSSTLSRTSCTYAIAGLAWLRTTVAPRTFSIEMS